MAKARTTPLSGPPEAREIGMMRSMAGRALRGGGGAAGGVCAMAGLRLAWSAGPARAQVGPQARVGNGSLRVAHEELVDAAFSETVVLVLRHDEVGTVGLIINRPTSLAAGTVFPELAEALTGYSGRLYRGGPSQPSRTLGLVQGLAAVVVQGPEVVDRIYLSVDASELGNLVRVAKDESSLRIFAGHAEWGPGQVDAEVARGVWRVLRGTSELIFAPDPSSVWQTATALATGSVIADAGTSRVEGR